MSAGWPGREQILQRYLQTLRRVARDDPAPHGAQLPRGIGGSGASP